MDIRPNLLHIGDNLDIVRRLIPDQSIDLVYLDPPFNKNRAYHLIFKDEAGRTSDAQQVAFTDTWHWGPTAEAHYRALALPTSEAAAPGTLHLLVGSLVEGLGRNQLTAYIVEMAVRLVELHRVLKPTGSIYLHCDPTASHYLKLVMDAIFGPTRFRTEIIWKRSSAHSDTKQGRRQHGRIHDVILFYTKGDNWTWNVLYTPYDESYIREFYRHEEPGTGRRYTLGDLTGPGGEAKGNPRYDVLGVTRYWRFSREKMQELLDEGRIVQTRRGAVPRYKRYLDEMSGVPLQDVWTDLDPVGARARERIGYPTQKPVPLLSRIIRTSSNEGDVVLDPFCGCGTGIEASVENGRQWIGIDVSDQALEVIDRRFRGLYGRPVPGGDIAPRDLATARALARSDKGRLHFQARPSI